jgi:aryl-alcohol dehydrogenase-like predicted oxidoreductase
VLRSGNYGCEVAMACRMNRAMAKQLHALSLSGGEIMNDQQVSRRDFVKTTGAVFGGMAAGAVRLRGLQAADGAAAGPEMPMATLGRTGVDVSRLGIGCAHFQRQHVTPDDVYAVIQRALELGVNFLDVAPNYGNEEIGFSEVKMGPTIKEIRDKVFLVTKTEEPTYEGTWRLLRQSMKRMQTDRLDLVHLHNFGNVPRFPELDLVFSKKGALGALQEAKKQGVIRFIGASGHLYPSRFHAALGTGEIDVVMNAVNFVVQHSYDFEHKVWARARQDDVALVAMKVLGGAKGASGFRVPEDSYEHAIRYVLSQPKLSTAVIGMENLNELEQAARTVAGAKPLEAEEQLALARRGLELPGTSDWQAAYGTPVD